MKVLVIAVKNVYELFVEDGSLVLVLLAWLGAAYAGSRWLGIPGEWRAPLLFAGCLAALIENIVRAAARRQRQGKVVATVRQQGKGCPRTRLRGSW